MGLIYSFLWPNEGRTDDPDPVTGLTSRDVFLVKTSWKQLNENTTATGVEIFLRLFTKEPAYHQLFPSFKDISLEDLPKNKRYQAHCNALMYGFSSIIDNVDNNELLIELLLKQGSNHKPRKVPDEAYGVLKEVLMEMFAEKMTKEALDAWEKTIDVGFPIILQGANSAK